MRPLPARMRPQVIDDICGQKHLLSPRSPFLNALSDNNIGSLLLWGPPGTGKTTLSLLIAKEINRQFVQLSAVHDGMKDLRKAVANETPLLGKKLL